MTASALQTRSWLAAGPRRVGAPARRTAPGLVREVPRKPIEIAPTASADFLSFYTSGMERATEAGNAWLSAAVCFNSCMMELYKDVCSPIPYVGNHLELAAKLFANCADQQMKWFGVWLPSARRRAVPIAGNLRHLGPGVPAKLLEMESEVLERAMDIAIGASAA